MKELLAKIQKCSEKELEDLIIEQANMMELEEPKIDRKYIYPFDLNVGYYRGFIPNDVILTPSSGYGSKDVYRTGDCEYLLEFFKSVKREKIDNVQDLILHLSSFMDDFFGVTQTNQETDDRKYFLREKDGNATINDFKNKNLAACSEKAVVVQNVLSLIGLDCYYITGMCNGVQHAYNIIKKKNGDLILVDSSYSCGLFNENKESIGNVSYICQLGNINDSNINNFLFQEKNIILNDLYVLQTESGHKEPKLNRNKRTYMMERINEKDILPTKDFNQTENKQI